MMASLIDDRNFKMRFMNIRPFRPYPFRRNG